MKKYRVNVRVCGHVEIEAASFEDAEEKVTNGEVFSVIDFDDGDIEIIDMEELEG